MEYSAEIALAALRSPLVDDELFARALGGGREDIDSVRLYLRLPIAARPEVSWYFDRDYYLERYPDIRRGGIDPLVHFLNWGVAESRSPHPLIDLHHIRATYGASVLPEKPNGQQLHALLVSDLVDPSSFFSREHYRRQCGDDALTPSGLLLHFLREGILRGLSPCPAIDVRKCYIQAGTGFDVRSGVRQLILRGGKLPGNDPIVLTEDATTALFRHKAQSLLPLFGRQPLDFTMRGPPEISVIMVLHSQFALTLMALASLRDNFPDNIELLIVDSGSTDETMHLSQYVRGHRAIRLDSDVGFARARSAALDLVTATYVLFLGNDVELAHGAIPAALHRIVSDRRIGAVGAKIIRSDGRLQDAGNIIWRSGATSGYLRDASPLAPEANFVRDVEYCSLTFLLGRADVVREVGGFDWDFAASQYGDADLCLRICRSGHRVVYDPHAVVFHFAGDRSQDEPTAHALVDQSRAVFLAKHRDELQLNYSQASGAELGARSVRECKGKILLIEDQIPLRRLGSGFVRSNDIIRSLSALGYAVTVYPVKPSDQSLAAIYGDLPESVEVMHDKALADLGSFTAARQGYYDAIWVCRTHNLALVKPCLEAYAGAARVILDTEAISAVRDQSRAAVTPDREPVDLRAKVASELGDTSLCAALIAVSDREADMLRELGHQRVMTLGHVQTPRVTATQFEDRAGMLFIGAIHELDSPNYDSLCWFAGEVLPLIERELGWETRLTVAGFVAPDIDLDRFRNHPRVTVRGPAADLVPLYASHRVFVAPTRFAAGLPYKLHEAASYGVPIVATELLRGQLGWQSERELLAADSSDPSLFARHCVRLYRSKELWTHLRDAAVERILLECDRSNYEAALAAIVAAT